MRSCVNGVEKEEQGFCLENNMEFATRNYTSLWRTCAMWLQGRLQRAVQMSKGSITVHFSVIVVGYVHTIGIMWAFGV